MAEQLMTLEQVEQLEKAIATQDAQKQTQFENESNRFSEFLLEDDLKNVPENLIDGESINKTFWSFWDKELALSNFQENDIKWILSKLEIVRLDTLMTYPDWKLKFSDIQQLDQMGIKAFAKIKRSTGGMERERALLATQIKQFMTNEMERPKGGVFSGIAGFFGRNKK